MEYNHRVLTEQQWPLSGVHSITMEKSVQASEDGGCTPTPFHYIYHHVQTCTLPLYVLCGYNLQHYITHIILYNKFITWSTVQAPSSLVSRLKASSDTVESEGRQMKQCWIQYLEKNILDNPPAEMWQKLFAAHTKDALGLEIEKTAANFFFFIVMVRYFLIRRQKFYPSWSWIARTYKRNTKKCLDTGFHAHIVKALGLQGTVCYNHHEMLPSQLLRITQRTANGLLAIRICAANKFQRVRR